MTKNKHHWYDGKFYDKIIAPNQDKLFAEIIKYIPENSTLLDIGCGTGRLEFQAAVKCKKVTGIDLSLENIETAKGYLRKSDYQNIEFIHANAAELENFIEEKVDFAVMTFVIHEMHPDERIAVLNSVKRLSKKIIIGEYSAPQPKNVWRIINRLVELAAGKDHYSNYKHFLNIGGIKNIAGRLNFDIVDEKPVGANTTLFILQEKKER